MKYSCNKAELKYRLQGKQHYILPIIKDPESVIGSQSKWLPKKMMKFNLSHFGTPIVIHCNLYNASFEELDLLFKEKLNREIII